MKRTLMILTASSALSAALGTPAASAIGRLIGSDPRPGAVAFETDVQARPLIVAGARDGGGEDDADRWLRGARRFAESDDDDDGNVRYRWEDDDDEGGRARYRREDHGDDDSHARYRWEDDDDDDDDDDGPGGARNPAPAGTVAPPQNGLFGKGAPPKVKVN